MTNARIVPADTTEEAHRLQGEIYRRMGGAARLNVAFRLTETVRQLSQAGIRQRHPGYTDEQVFHAWARLTLGDALYCEVWPDRELLQP